MNIFSYGPPVTRLLRYFICIHIASPGMVRSPNTVVCRTLGNNTGRHLRQRLPMICSATNDLVAHPHRALLFPLHYDLFAATRLVDWCAHKRGSGRKCHKERRRPGLPSSLANRRRICLVTGNRSIVSTVRLARATTIGYNRICRMRYFVLEFALLLKLLADRYIMNGINCVSPSRAQPPLQIVSVPFAYLAV